MLHQFRMQGKATHATHTTNEQTNLTQLMQHMSGCTHIPKCSCIIAILYAFIITAKAFHGVEFGFEGLKCVWLLLFTKRSFGIAAVLTSSRGKDWLLPAPRLDYNDGPPFSASSTTNPVSHIPLLSLIPNIRMSAAIRSTNQTSSGIIMGGDVQCTYTKTTPPRQKTHLPRTKD